ncbi:glycosyl transferase [Stenotrophomonas rhizophila]|uniref:glycosyltransferase family 2 protein n=1 Tax=Stenotrophomonas rhizophila TaxID=216778 RepID=UPI00081C919F|nr:glycosyltransferase family 2 protein [Stenotrophomonas rhizophila]AOA71135.1 glycosyl transferase [Stenotrophomonas rhizophila]MDQ1063949.1 glycosyltransferase involved in cell wall biosynthesis [Stenotrophomonas sp. SORGH_AS_0282]MDQ1187683.1 glycosyltransferase involved in cell wall biosynthesis [Stenotrophomonas sp. SORGH_AS_0282]PAK91007.1 glycosyl transferase [Stenotrophomonas rhizophila]
MKLHTAAPGALRKKVLVIQIPCLNEAATLKIAIDALPRQVPGFDEVKILIIDDGSTDGTSELALRLGVDHIVRHPVNRGLATAFMSGLEAALCLGADVIVNTDADNQYCADDIPLLTQPILEHRADMVIGARPIDETEHFSLIKKKLQRIGSWAVRMASQTDVHDAPSGFRAISREAAIRINVFGGYTYTLETIIQAGLSGLVVASVPIRTNADLRPSRLVKSIASYVVRSLVTIARVLMIYRPLLVFSLLGAVPLLLGLVGGLRFAWFYAIGEGGGHVQSVVFSAFCLTLAAIMFTIGLISDLIATNRKLSERILRHVRQVEHRLEQLE